MFSSCCVDSVVIIMGGSIVHPIKNTSGYRMVYLSSFWCVTLAGNLSLQ